MTALARAGELAVAEADRLWALDVIDPQQSDKTERANRSREHIDRILVQAGWHWMVPYRGDRWLEWCGLFVGACWRAAGLDPKWISTYFASTYRLDLWGRYRSFNAATPNPKPATDLRLMAELDQSSKVLPFEPMPGDILTIGDGAPPFGDHICLVESFDQHRRVFKTIEGNGLGVGPDRKRRQGVVRAERHLGGGGYCARRLIRPGFGDLVAEQS